MSYILITPLVIACILGESLHNTKLDEAYLFTSHVLINRMNDSRWPDTLEEVVLQSKQFSCMNDPENVRKLLNQQKYHPSIWEKARTALELASIQRKDPTMGATNYLTIKLFNSSKCPAWAKKLEVTIIKYGHVYLK